MQLQSEILSLNQEVVNFHKIQQDEEFKQNSQIQEIIFPELDNQKNSSKPVQQPKQYYNPPQYQSQQPPYQPPQQQPQQLPQQRPQQQQQVQPGLSSTPLRHLDQQYINQCLEVNLNYKLSCGHEFCWTCLNIYLSNKIENVIDSDTIKTIDRFNIRCPQERIGGQCSHIITSADLSSFERN
eukprot:TRINITY_DN8294_c0_g1_i4.p2 TRINITY_DN8294_c0_g1~~TRINITY_DN8294_c0_g1_i4.p2  ORF type:complete len:182 (+),score=25.20 TRINITY_DN8294_c0_g1_i4:237-782(+)